MLKQILLSTVAGSLVLGVCSCASTQYDTDLKTDYVDRKSLEKCSDDEITSLSIDPAQLKKERKCSIGVILTVEDMTQGRARLPDSAQLGAVGYSAAENFLQQTKAYRVQVLPPKTQLPSLMSGKEFNGVKYDYYIDMHVVMTSEIEERLEIDEAMYKTTIDWKLIDNRTKANGLGKLDAPVIKESLTCRNLTVRKINITSVRGDRMGGSELRNAQNAYYNTLMNSLLQFRAQLSNRVPYGGKIKSIRLKDGNVNMTLNAGPENGIVKRMQMMIIDESGDQVAIATASGGVGNTTTLRIWRWMSPSSKKAIIAAASDKKKLESWMDENMLYAVCLGTPPPAKDEIKNYKDTLN